MTETRDDYKAAIDKVHRGYIVRDADEIRRRIIGGTLYGLPVTADDIDALIVAAFHAGISSASKTGRDGHR